MSLHKSTSDSNNQLRHSNDFVNELNSCRVYDIDVRVDDFQLRCVRAIFNVVADET